MPTPGEVTKTQEAYAKAVRQLADYYSKSPDQISEEELRNYFLYLKNEKQVSRSTCTQALCGIDERLLWVACGLFANQFG